MKNGTQPKHADAGQLLQAYLREINDNALLSADEERALAHAIARGDNDARTRMIQANLRLVVKIAREYLGRGVVLEDLIGEGNVGLIRAAEAFKPNFGTRFSTYASYWIKQSICLALINTTTMIRLPSHIVALLTKWRRAERTLSRERGCEPSFNEVASFLGLSDMQKTMVAKAHHALQLKLESTVAAESGRWLPVDSDSHYESPDASMNMSDERAILSSRMQRLDVRERTILTLRYGLGGTSPLTLKEISRRLNVTREWVRKIELRAVRKLADAAVENQGGDSIALSSRRRARRFQSDSSTRSRPSRSTTYSPHAEAAMQVRGHYLARAAELTPQRPAAAVVAF
jgi:RNA polymerase primary sigma factor